MLSSKMWFLMNPWTCWAYCFFALQQWLQVVAHICLKRPFMSSMRTRKITVQVMSFNISIDKWLNWSTAVRFSPFPVASGTAQLGWWFFPEEIPLPEAKKAWQKLEKEWKKVPRPRMDILRLNGCNSSGICFWELEKLYLYLNFCWVKACADATISCIKSSQDM